MEIWIDQNWRHRRFRAVSLGDKPTGVVLDLHISLQKVAAMFSSIHRSAAEK